MRQHMARVGLVIATMLWAGSVQADEASPTKSRSFLFGLNDGERVDILSHGPLTLFARCELDRPQVGTNNIVDALELIVTSSVDGWIISGDGETAPAGQEKFVIQLEDPVGIKRILVSNGGQFAIAPNGDIMLVGNVIMGLNVGEFDCFVGGSVVNLKGDIF